MDDVKRRRGRPPKQSPVVMRLDVDGAVIRDALVKSWKSEPAAAALPASVTLAHLYSYYADDGLLRTWGQGVVVTDPAEIADLIARGAPLKG